MSLTTFIKQEDVDILLDAHFLKSGIMSSIKAERVRIKAPAQTKNYALIGTAFDYMLRFYAGVSSIGTVKESMYVAEYSLEALKSNLGERHPKTKKVEELLDQVKVLKDDCISRGTFTRALMVAFLNLSKVDRIYRSGDLDYPLDFDDIDEYDVLDLQNLFRTLKDSQLIAEIRAASMISANPHFGAGSTLVNGADADIVIDGTLIDVKTTKYLKLSYEYLYQLFGYYILSIHDDIYTENQDECFRHESGIERIGIYFSRHGYLVTISIDDIMKRVFGGNEHEFNEFYDNMIELALGDIFV